MTTSLFMAFALPIALQAAATSSVDAAREEPGSPPIASFDDLPIEQAAAPRCGVAFAVVAGWQKEEDARGFEFPNMETEGGREFFVRSIAELMEKRSLSREAVSQVIATEASILTSPEGNERVRAMMPACLLMKRSAGL